MKKHFTFLLTLLPFIFITNSICAQDQTETVSLHVNCPQGCDMNYIRQEIKYLNHVREQGLADVQAFITRIRAGNGGDVYELLFTGKKDFEGIDQKLVYETNPNQTWDEIRAGLLKRIEAGVLPYLLNSGFEEEVSINVDYEISQGIESPVAQSDPWDYWIFEVNGSGNFQKESQRERFNVEFGIEANRITEQWKYEGRAELNFNESTFDSGEEVFISTRTRHFFNGSVVRSLGKRWSAGVFGNFRHDTFRNLDLSYSISPAIEYSLYPYSEAIRREITFVYRMNLEQNDYIEQTIYGRTTEGLARQSFTIRSRFRQPWGNLFASFEASNYMHDFSKNRLVLDGFVSIRIFQGFNVRFSTEVQLIRDLITLPGGESSLEDILLRQRQIATDFTTEFGMGISYTFGSAFNSIVNPRL
ncbi:MAG: DUF481 domain-containing protein [Bacteroidota bacterium]